MLSRSVCVLQIGSYFGSVLQTLDVDNDSYTDLLLVGAPMFMGPERDEQGQVYVYRLNSVLQEREGERWRDVEREGEMEGYGEIDGGRWREWK